MKYKASIFDILQAYVNNMTYVTTIYEVVSSVPAPEPRSGNDITLNVDDVYWAVIGATLSIGGKNYTIVSWDESYNLQDGIMQLVVNDANPTIFTIASGTYNFTGNIVQSGSNYINTGAISVVPSISGFPSTGTIIFSGGTYSLNSPTSLTVIGGIATVTISAGSFTFYPPFFAHGTVREEANQLLQQPSTWAKYPLIWAREGVTEDFNNDRETQPERTSDLTIYFLTDNNPNLEGFNIYELYTRPMTRLKDNFIKSFNTESGYYPIGIVDRDDMTIKTTEITKVGISIASKDVKKNILIDNLSGVAIEMRVKLLRPEPYLFGAE